MAMAEERIAEIMAAIETVCGECGATDGEECDNCRVRELYCILIATRED